MSKVRIISTLTAVFLFLVTLYSCEAQKAAASQKTGAQLWGENCIRCHNIPSPGDYNDVDWETIGLHMRIRANLTEDEIDKIVEFMKTVN